MGGCRARRGTNGLGRRGRKRGLQTELAVEIGKEIDALVGREGLSDFEALETAARRGALWHAARLLERRLNEDLSDHSGTELSCRCGKTARFAGRRPKTFQTVLGPLDLLRAYYHCSDCGAGFHPRDRQLGLEETSLSPAVTRMVGLVGASVSFEEGAELLRELAGVSLSVKQVERTAESLGEEIAAEERRETAPEPDRPVPPTLYLGLDGTGVPMRPTELKGRAGKQADGSAKTREAKLCVVWSAETRDRDGKPVRDEESVSYSAAIESAAQGRGGSDPLPEFLERVTRETSRRNFDRAARQVVLGDGAAWIWNATELMFPRAVQIVDLFHAKEHLSEAARAIWGVGSQLGKAWARERHDELDAGKLRAVVRALATQKRTCPEVRSCVGYIFHNRRKMRYPAYRSRGLCVSTGVVEAGCARVVGNRLKRSGTRSRTNGANSILALRCSKRSRRYEGFWERRADKYRPAA